MNKWVIVAIVILLPLLVWAIVSGKAYEAYEDVQIIHLVLYSPSFPYEDMRQATLPLYQQHAPSVATLYYCYTPNLSTASFFDETTRILHLRGTETYVPGILDKTIDAMAYALDRYPTATMIVRSNASTVLDFPSLLKEVNGYPGRIDYGGGMLNTLAWLDPAAGVVDKTWWGTPYASGTCIFLSRAYAEKMVQERSLLRRNLVDDLSIGVWMREYHPEIQLWKSGAGGWLYRNRRKSRAKDVEAVKACVDSLLKIKR